MLFPQYFIDDLKERADIVRIIQPYAPDLKKKGANWMACCPFHQEKTPSFSVNPTKGFYKCFGCGKGGTAFNFLMEIEGLNFPEAVRRVAESSGIALPEPVDDDSFQRSKKQREEKKRAADGIIELNRVAMEFWESALQEESAGAAAARAYLNERGITEDVQRHFRLGYSPASWDGLLQVLRDFGADDQMVAASGLVTVNEEKKKAFDRFRNRIMFPVLDVEGRPVAFGARALSSDDEPKYLNSPETAAYVKGSHLYGLYQGKDEIRKRRFSILVEGYLDLIALVQFGITNVAASLGTAFTNEQARLLSRFSKSVVINYDGDTAGVKAARKAIEVLLSNDVDVKVLVLPGGMDPDDFVRENGAAAYNQLRGRAEPFLAFAMRTATEGRNLGNARQKAEAIESVLPVVSAIRNSIQKRESFDQVMAFFRIDDPGLKRELWNTFGRTGDTSVAVRKVSRAATVKTTLAERRLLELLIFDRELRDAILPVLEPDDYQHLATGGLFDALIAIDRDTREPAAETFLELLADDDVAIDTARQLLAGEPRRNAGESIDAVLRDAENCVYTLRGIAIENRIDELNREAVVAQQSGDTALANSLALEQLDLEKLRRQLLNRVAKM